MLSSAPRVGVRRQAHALHFPVGTLHPAGRALPIHSMQVVGGNSRRGLCKTVRLLWLEPAETAQGFGSADLKALAASISF